MPININIGGNVETLIVNGNPLQKVLANGVEVWSAAPAVQASEFVFTFPSATTQDIYLTQSAANAVTVDWGDNSQTEQSANLETSFSHSYAAGTYTAKITCAQGETWTPGGAGNTVSIWNGTTNSTLVSMTLKDGCAIQAASKLRRFQNSESLVSAYIYSSDVTIFPAQTFAGCASLTTVLAPATITQFVTSWSQNTLPTITSLTILASTPPATAVLTQSGLAENCIIYVPAASVAEYQAASGWSDRAAHIQAIPS